MSQRFAIKNNVNGCKNTRLSIQDVAIGDFRTDHLAHMSRYSKIASLMLKESRSLKRPLNVLDIGCGELWALKVLYKAHVCKKASVIGNYLGIDIDDKMIEKQYAQYKSIIDIFGGELTCQDVTVDPEIDLDYGTVDFFYSTEVIEHMKKEFVPTWLDHVNDTLRVGSLIYISTPNHDGSNDKLPEDHIYEWGYQELKEELESRWELVDHTGTFIKLNTFKRANHGLKRVPEDVLEVLETRFDNFWLRNVLAAFYPEYSNNVAWILRKME